MHFRHLFINSLAILYLTTSYVSAQGTSQLKDAEPATKAVHERFLSELPFSDRDDFESASRGLIAPLPDGEIKNANGTVAWDMRSYDFLKADKAPDTVNPSLWRQEQLNNQAGLFKVIDGIYQVRGFDLSNMTIIEGRTGLIVIDPLITTQTSSAGLRKR